MKIIKTLKDNWQICCTLVVFLIIKSYFAFTRYRLPIWDESVYVGIGKYIFSFGHSGLWEIIRPLGLPIITGLLWIMGIKTNVTTAYYEFVMLLFSCAFILMVYVVAKEIFNKKVAIISSILCAVAPLFFLYSGYILTEIPSAVFVLLAIYTYVRKKYLAAGIFSGIAFMFKFPQGIILAILLATLILYAAYEYITKNSVNNKNNNNINNKTDKKKISKTKASKFLAKKIYKDVFSKALLITIGFLIIVVPFLIFNYAMYHSYTGTITDAVFRPMILAAPHQSNPFDSIITNSFLLKLYNIFYYIIVMAKDYWIFGLFIPALLFLVYRIYQSHIKRKLSENQLSIIIATILYLLYWSIISNKQDRFFIVMLPFVAMITAYLIWSIFDSRFDSKINMALFIIIAVFTLVATLTAMGFDVSYYTWRPALNNKPEIITGLYQQPDMIGVNGSILITDPVFAIFTDKKILPYYFSVQGQVVFFNEWEKDDTIGAVEFNANSLSCMPQDTVCLEKKKQLLLSVENQYTLVFNKTYYDTPYYIFIPKK